MSVLTDSAKQQLVYNTPDPQKPKITKSRNRLYGDRSTPEKILKEVAKLVGKFTQTEIAEMIGKSESQTKRYIAKAKEQNLVTTSESGRLLLSDETKAQNYSKELDHDSFIQKHPKVENWVEMRKAEAKGEKTKLNRVRAQLGRLKVICDSIKINPLMMLAPDEHGLSYGGLSKVMAAFIKAMREGNIVYQRKVKHIDPDKIEAAYREYLMAARSFATYNGLQLLYFITSQELGQIQFLPSKHQL